MNSRSRHLCHILYAIVTHTWLRMPGCCGFYNQQWAAKTQQLWWLSSSGSPLLCHFWHLVPLFFQFVWKMIFASNSWCTHFYYECNPSFLVLSFDIPPEISTFAGWELLLQLTFNFDAAFTFQLQKQKPKLGKILLINLLRGVGQFHMLFYACRGFMHHFKEENKTR